jgi:hypothetical protein
VDFPVPFGPGNEQVVRGLHVEVVQREATWHPDVPQRHQEALVRGSGQRPNCKQEWFRRRSDLGAFQCFEAAGGVADTPGDLVLHAAGAHLLVVPFEPAGRDLASSLADEATQYGEFFLFLREAPPPSLPLRWADR